MCYLTCPEGANFCDDNIDTTILPNIETTINYGEKNAYTTNIVVTTNRFERLTSIINVETTYNFENLKNIETINNKISDNFEKTTSLIDTTNNLEEKNIIDTTNNDKIIIPEERNKISTYEPNIDTSIAYTTTINRIISIITTVKNIISEKSYYNITGENNEEIYEEIKDIIKNFIREEPEDLIIKGKNNYVYHITTTDNEKDALNGNSNSTNPVSKIDLGECENILKDFYHIERSVSLIIIKYEKVANASSERSLQYEVYEPFNNTKLNLSVCENTTITVYTPVVLSQELLDLYEELKDLGYDLFNINSSFYTDICTPFKSADGTDVPLSDRINSYFNNDETMCQPNCKFADYSVETRLLKCECDVSNTEINTKVEKKFTKNTVYQAFYDSLKFSNYKVLKCYKLAFHMNSVTVNKGSIIAIIYFSLYFIFLIIYIIKGIKQLKIDYVKEIMSNNPNHNNNVIKVDKEKEKINEKQEKNTSHTNEKKTQQAIQTQQKYQINLREKSKSKTAKRKSAYKNKNHHNYPPKKMPLSKDVSSSRVIGIKNPSRNVDIYTKRMTYQNLIFSNKLNSLNKNTENGNQINVNNYIDSQAIEIVPKEKLSEYELNNLEYDEAINLDKRSFLEMYWSTLKREHSILFTFFVRNDYNLIYVKFSRFIFLVCTDVALNVFFFSDDTMHKMYLDYGKYNFIQHIPQFAYSTLVSQMIQVFLCFLSMTDKHFYEIKSLDYDSRFKVFEIIKCVKIKLTVYFIFTFIMFGFYWYAISCF